MILQKGFLLLIFFVVAMPAEAVDIAKDLKDRCSDGKERVVVYTLDNTVIDISQNISEKTVEWNLKKLENACIENQELIIGHCHTYEHESTLFPSVATGSNLLNSDFGSMFYQEFICSKARTKRGKEKPKLNHYLFSIYHNTLVSYGMGEKIKLEISRIVDDLLWGLHVIESDKKMLAQEKRKFRFFLFEAVERDYMLVLGDLSKKYKKALDSYLVDSCLEGTDSGEWIFCKNLKVSVFSERVTSLRKYFYIYKTEKQNTTDLSLLF